MISTAELSGIVDAMGAATPDEIQGIIGEFAYIRHEEIPDPSEIKELCRTALKDHLIEVVSSNEVTVADTGEAVEPAGGAAGGSAGAAKAGAEAEAGEADVGCYYIPGPNAFPEIPFEMSEVIDILELYRREVDMGKVAKSFSTRLKRRATSLNNKIDSFTTTPPTPDDIAKLEKRYSDLINVYYDYDFWLPGELSDMEDVISMVSGKLARLKSTLQ
ncbi:MAG: hypothetical protein JXA98_03475 [Methanosarcinaceae archaeon]|nr:hypothetical protein [Methanosarcinaceae archaeon]